METVAEGLKFERLDEGWKVAGYEDIGKSVDIPADVDGVPVTMVGAHAFEDARGLEHISIPESVTFVGNYAFWGCTSLTQVDIPHSLTVLNLGTFRGCTALAHVTVPDSMELLGDGVFQGCTALQNVSLPETIVEQAGDAFPAEQGILFSVSSESMPQDGLLEAQQAQQRFRETAESLRLPDDTTWTCSQGHSGNTGLFCPLCGEPKPEE